MKLKRVIKYNFIKLLRLKTEAREVALGITLGFIPNWYPTFGTGPIISVFLAKIFRVNVISAFVGGISGTLVWPILFYFNYVVGNFLFHSGSSVNKININNSTSVDLFYYRTKSIGYEFLIGSLINIVISSIIIYFVTYVIFKKYRSVSLNRLKK